MADFVIKQGDTRPAIEAQLEDKGVAINLTAATAVKFIMRQQGSLVAPKVTGACGWVDRTTGMVAYTWIAADTDTVGLFDGEFEITWTDGGVQTVPASGYVTIEVTDDLE